MTKSCLMVISLVGLALTQSACRNHGVVIPPSASRDHVTNSVVDTTETECPVRVSYTLGPQPFWFRVGETDIGSSQVALTKWLHNNHISRIVFVSDYKFTSEGARRLISSLAVEGIHVCELWLPRSTGTGWLEFISGATSRPYDPLPGCKR